jgi:hypothetical protein
MVAAESAVTGGIESTVNDHVAVVSAQSASVATTRQ